MIIQHSSLDCKFFPIITGCILSLTCVYIFSRSIVSTNKEYLLQVTTLPLCFEDDTF